MENLKRIATNYMWDYYFNLNNDDIFNYWDEILEQVMADLKGVGMNPLVFK